MLPRKEEVVRAGDGHRPSDGDKQFLAARAAVVIHVVGSFCGEYGHHRLAGSKSAANGEWWPGAGLLVLREAVGVLRRRAVRGPIQVPWPRTAEVDEDEMQGAPDGRVGAPALTQAVVPGVDLGRLPGGSAYQYQRSAGVSRGHDPDRVELLGQHRAQGRDHDRKGGRRTPGHDRVGGQGPYVGNYPGRRDWPDRRPARSGLGQVRVD